MDDPAVCTIAAVIWKKKLKLDDSFQFNYSNYLVLECEFSVRESCVS